MAISLDEKFMKACYKIMFRLIKEVFIVSLSFCRSLATKYVTLIMNHV